MIGQTKGKSGDVDVDMAQGIVKNSNPPIQPTPAVKKTALNVADLLTGNVAPEDQVPGGVTIPLGGDAPLATIPPPAAEARPADPAAEPPLSIESFLETLSDDGETEPSGDGEVLFMEAPPAGSPETLVESHKNMQRGFTAKMMKLSKDQEEVAKLKEQLESQQTSQPAPSAQQAPFPVSYGPVSAASLNEAQWGVVANATRLPIDDITSDFDKQLALNKYQEMVQAQQSQQQQYQMSQYANRVTNDYEVLAKKRGVSSNDLVSEVMGHVHSSLSARNPGQTLDDTISFVQNSSSKLLTDSSGSFSDDQVDSILKRMGKNKKNLKRLVEGVIILAKGAKTNRPSAGNLSPEGAGITQTSVGQTATTKENFEGFQAVRNKVMARLLGK